MRADTERKMAFWNDGHPMFSALLRVRGGVETLEVTLYPWDGRKRTNWDLAIPRALRERRIRVVLPLWGFSYSHLDEETQGLEAIFNHACEVLNVRDGFSEIGWEIESIGESSFLDTACLTVILTAPGREVNNGEVSTYWECTPVDSQEGAIERARRLYSGF